MTTADATPSLPVAVADAAAAAVDDVRARWAEEWAARPRLRGWSHVVAAPLAAVGVGLLARRRKGHRAAIAAYGAGLASMFSVSAAYHRLPHRYETYRWHRAADHATIFAAIAGTATPLAAASLPKKAAVPVIAGLWATAAAAGGRRAWALLTDRSGALWEYAAVSTVAGVLAPAVLLRHGARTTALVAAGGAAYIAGATVFAKQAPNPVAGWFGYHEVWHAATITGAAFHLAAVASATADRTA